LGGIGELGIEDEGLLKSGAGGREVARRGENLAEAARDPQAQV
jgi:hypothetical protein